MTARASQYVPVHGDMESTKLLPPRYSVLGPQLQMAASLLYSTLLMLLHHFWNLFLDGKAVSSTAHVVFGRRLTNQAISEVVGNGIAYVVGTSLAAGIGVGFVQVLWLRLRRGQYTLREVDAMFSCKGGAFSRSSLLTWRCALSLAAMGSSMSLMSVITIVAPGSLRVESSEFAFPSPCTVPTVSLSKANISTIFFQPLSQDSNGSLELEERGLGGLNLQRFSEQVFLRGSPLPPTNPCGGDCKYDIQFNAPASHCVPLGSNFPPIPSPNSGDPVVWWGQHSAGLSGTSLQALSQSPAGDFIDGADCAFYNATYSATITHSNSTSQVMVSSTEFTYNEVIAPVIVVPEVNATRTRSVTAFANTKQQYVQLVFSLWPILETSIVYKNSTAEFQASSSSPTNSTILAYSPVFETSFDNPWKMSCSTSTLISSFMSNISVSLLNDLLSTEQNPTTAPYNTTCWRSSDQYTYDAERLLITYGCGIAVAAISMLFGVRAIYLNGMEESLAFSRILGATLNESLFEERHELSKISCITGEGGTHGSLRLVSAASAQDTSSTSTDK